MRLGVVLLSVLAIACSGRTRPPYPLAVDEDASAAADAPTGFDVALPDAAPLDCSAGTDAGICACTEIGQKPTPLYVVLDRSGSMNERPGGGQSKWQVITTALLHAKTGVLRALGARVSVGMAVFPRLGASDTCTPGAEVFATASGSPATYDKLASILNAMTPYGSTPTAPTLRALAPELKALPKPAFVLLATDGAPNCGDTPCEIDRCIYNREGYKRADGSPCDASVNCCDPKLVPEGAGWKACVDAEGTRAAVEDLAAAGIKVFVFGAPGVGPFENDLNELAKAGGTAREDAKPGEPLFYAASDATHEAFTAALKAIAAKVVDSCIIELEKPSDPGVTNVLVDGALVPQDPIDGWAWTPDGKVELRGKTCDRVKSGTVVRVQVAVGCKTVTK